MNRRRMCGDDSDTDEETENNEQVKTVNNCIYFYASVTKASVLEFNTQLRKLRDKLVINAGFGFQKPEIIVYINSGGGDLYAGLSAMDHIKNCDVHVTTVVDGLAASAATFMVVAGKRRLMFEHSQVLIHQLTTNFWGRYQDLLDEVKACNQLMTILKGIYNKYTKIPEKKFKVLMKKEIYMGADKCVKFGVIDQII